MATENDLDRKFKFLAISSPANAVSFIFGVAMSDLVDVVLYKYTIIHVTLMLCAGLFVILGGCVALSYVFLNHFFPDKASRKEERTPVTELDEVIVVTPRPDIQHRDQLIGQFDAAGTKLGVHITTQINVLAMTGWEVEKFIREAIHDEKVSKAQVLSVFAECFEKIVTAERSLKSAQREYDDVVIAARAVKGLLL